MTARCLPTLHDVERWTSPTTPGWGIAERAQPARAVGRPRSVRIVGRSVVAGTAVCIVVSRRSRLTLSML